MQDAKYVWVKAYSQKLLLHVLGVIKFLVPISFYVFILVFDCFISILNYILKKECIIKLSLGMINTIKIKRMKKLINSSLMQISDLSQILLNWIPFMLNHIRISKIWYQSTMKTIIIKKLLSLLFKEKRVLIVEVVVDLKFPNSSNNNYLLKIKLLKVIILQYIILAE